MVSLSDEKQKLDYGHKLEKKRIWLDKALIASLILLAGFVANYVLEGYKSDLAKTQFLLDRRLEAIKDLRVSFSKLNQYAYDETYKAPNADHAAYAKEVDAFIHIGNKWGFLFSEAFENELNQYLWLHHAASSGKIKLTTEHYNFMQDINDAFDTATKNAVTVEVLGNPRPASSTHFHVQKWTAKEVGTKGAVPFFLENFDKWKKENPS
jgi:hypothetical protein